MADKTSIIDVVPLDVGNLNINQPRPSSVRTTKVVQAFDSNRVEPIEANKDGNKDNGSTEKGGKEVNETVKNELFSLEVDLKDTKQQVLYAFLGIVGIFLGALWSSSYFLIPERNIFDFDGFHYETFFVMILVYMPMQTSKMFINAYYINGYRWENTKQVWFKIVLAGSFGYGSAWILLHVYQTEVRGLCPPFPAHSSIAMLFGGVLFPIMFIWFQYPAEFRKKKIFRKRYVRFATSYVPIMFVVWFVYSAILPVGFVMLPTNDWQWIMALILPAFREFSVWFYTWYNTKHAEERDKKPIGDLFLHDMATRHAIALSITVTTQATTETSFLLLGIDFAINVLLAINIIRKKRNNPEENVDHDVEELMIAEKVEFVIPLLYYLTFLMGYYGPNGDLFGGMRIKIWERQNLLEPELITYWLTIFFVIDVGSLVVSAMLLWVFCRINCFPHYLKISVAYWLAMALQESHWTNEVRNKSSYLRYYFQIVRNRCF